jgi:hypothetical protein
MSDDTGPLLWAVDVMSESIVDIDSELNKLPLADKQRLGRFFCIDDRHRGLVSYLLQRAIVRNHLQVSTDEGIEINKTAEVRHTFLVQL